MSSSHWAIIIADGVAGIAALAAIGSALYARRQSTEATKARQLAEKADARAEKAEQRIETEEARNAVRWQLEVSHEPNRLWLRNIGTQDASDVTVLHPDPPLVRTEESRHWIVAGDAFAVLVNDPQKTVTSLMIAWSNPHGGHANVPLPKEWLTAAAPQPAFTIERGSEVQYRLRNVGDAVARGLVAEADQGIVRELPSGVDLSPGQAHTFLILHTDASESPDALKVRWDGLIEPLYVPVPD